MSVNYETCQPLANSSSYRSSDLLNFVPALKGKRSRGGYALRGSMKTYKNRGANTLVTAADQIFYDNVAGWQSLINYISVSWEKGGNKETFNDYGGWRHAVHLATKNDEALGTESDTAVMGCAPTPRVAKGMLAGVSSKGAGYIDFYIPLDCIMNKMTGNPSYRATGHISIDIKLTDDATMFWGSDVVAGQTSFDLEDVYLDYQTILDDGAPLVPMSGEVMFSQPFTLDSTEFNMDFPLSQNPCKSIHGRFVSRATLSDPTRCSLVAEPPPGIPPLTSGLTDVPADYGFERVIWSLNGDQTALYGWQFDSQMEILRTAIASFNDRDVPNLIQEAQQYSCLLNKLRNPYPRDGYLVGVSFGPNETIDLSEQSVSVRFDSEISSNAPYEGIFYFRCKHDFMG